MSANDNIFITPKGEVDKTLLNRKVLEYHSTSNWKMLLGGFGGRGYDSYNIKLKQFSRIICQMRSARSCQVRQTESHWGKYVSSSNPHQLSDRMVFLFLLRAVYSKITAQQCLVYRLSIKKVEGTKIHRKILQIGISFVRLKCQINSLKVVGVKIQMIFKSRELIGKSCYSIEVRACFNDATVKSV